ncbi:MFS transporter [Roseibacterium sp. SDUM158017]|uniref:MFS transporter n=1 Tax=Roseicyclus salinarum TaxID=3036773 RepID=UPI002414EC1C|nr:MFS transporter [Roseibacterium sp. SDUM158017]MDG4647860.1 MFS transporter [Roseibacterium sp. SDUM158017]
MTASVPAASVQAPAAFATRLSFFAAGFVMAAWASLIPFAKAQVGANDAQLGVLLLCLGIGSIVAMPVTGYVSARRGARGMVLLGGFGLVALLPVLLLAPSALTLGIALFLFGGALGTIDVSMNVHASEVERLADRPLMSGFHAMWSVGGIAGAGGMAGLLTLGLPPLAAAFAAASLAALAMTLATPRLLRARADEVPTFAPPRGIVLLLAGLTAAVFLIEGAILDWGALLSVERGLLETARAGLGFMLFSVAMAAGRLLGDRIVALIGPFATLFGGGIVVAFGIALMLLSAAAAPALAGFFLVGLGAANLVPVLFSAAGRQKVMAPGLAIAAVTSTGYAGILLGPALIGFASQVTSLSAAFWGLAALVLVFPATARVVART